MEFDLQPASHQDEADRQTATATDTAIDTIPQPAPASSHASRADDDADGPDLSGSSSALSLEEQLREELGEESEADFTDENASSVSASSKTSDHMPVPTPLATLVRQRLSFLMQIDRLEQARRQFRKANELSTAAQSELDRQSRELQRFPSAEQAAATDQRLRSKLEKLLQQQSEYERQQQNQADSDTGDNTTPDAQQSAGSNPGTAASDATNAQDAPDQASQSSAPDEGLMRALNIGLHQIAIFEQRDALTAKLVEHALPLVQLEPAFLMLSKIDAEPEQLFSLVVYILALERFHHHTQTKIDALRQAAQAAQKQGNTDRADAIEQESKLLSGLQTAIGREKKAVEPIAVEDFWRLYETLSLAWIQKQIDNDQIVHARAMLRFGLIIEAPWMMSPDITRMMLDSCQDSASQFEADNNATHILYADEYIDFVSRGLITPSLDEDLELNQKGSDAWKEDRFWRRMIFSRSAIDSLKQCRRDVEDRTAQVDQQLDEIGSSIEALDRKDPQYRKAKKDLMEQMQAAKVLRARLERAIELIEQKFMPDQQHNLTEAGKKLPNPPAIMTPLNLAKREAHAVRRLCRLCARLKEPLLPLVVRDRFKPENRSVNDRDTLLSEVHDIEKRDPSIFRQVLAHAKLAEQRVHQRQSPYIIIMPGMGSTGMSWNPRSGSEVGRIAVPLISARPGGLTDMLYQIFSDFRYDTSKESAGVDLLTSDTLVAAYATAKWNYRKRSKEIREKAGIYNDEKDRLNWRRHYKLYMDSAMDGGKKLYFKCPEIYEAVVKYMGLPEGVAKLG